MMIYKLPLANVVDGHNRGKTTWSIEESFRSINMILHSCHPSRGQRNGIQLPFSNVYRIILMACFGWDVLGEVEFVDDFPFHVFRVDVIFRPVKKAVFSRVHAGSESELWPPGFPERALSPIQPLSCTDVINPTAALKANSVCVCVCVCLCVCVCVRVCLG